MAFRSAEKVTDFLSYAGPDFVTRKVSYGVARIYLGLSTQIELGNLDAKRDWGHAKDYVRGIYAMMHQEYPEDLVLATGQTREVREFTEAAFRVIGTNLRCVDEQNHSCDFATNI